MIKRWQEQNLKVALNERRGVYLTGVWQIGKTYFLNTLDGAGWEKWK